jgi:predicted ArsR family transcriptional regulator
MSFDTFAEPVVKSPRDARPKIGRGFSIDEAKQAGLTIAEARRMGLIVDLRRKTTHQENTDALKQYAKDVKKIAATVLKPKSVKGLDKAIDELSSLRAVKKVEAKQLAEIGIMNMSDLAYCEITKVAKKTGIDEDRVTAMVKAALKKV